MRSYVRMVDNQKEERITRLVESLYAIGLYESILIKGNMTMETHEKFDNRYTSRYARGSNIGFLTKTKYWL